VKHGGLYIAQQPGEFRAWTKRVAAIRPKTYLEIGSLNGGTLMMIAPALEKGATIIAVDVAFRPRLAHSLNTLKAMGFETHVLTADSTAPDMSGKLADILGACWIDAAFIDGDHCFAAALSDYRLCLKMTRQGGLLGFHDIATISHTDIALFHSVDKVWEYIKTQHPNTCTEYVSKLPAKRPPCGSVGNGIGVVEV